MPDDSVAVKLKLIGASLFKKDADAAAKSISKVGASTSRAGKQTNAATGNFAKAQQQVRGFGKSATGVEVGLAGIGAGFGLLAKTGIGFNASMEQNQIAFTQFLGSADKATSFVAGLQRLNMSTPFEFPELADAARRLLAFGFTADETTGMLRNLTDAAAGTATGGEGLGRLALAIGQIQAKGKLSAEELNQLTDVGVGGQLILQKQLGLTGAELQSKLQKGAIDSKTAITALNAGLHETFGGSAVAQARTFTGQVSNLSDNFNMLLGDATKPLFNYLRDTGLPAINKLAYGLRQGRVEVSALGGSFGVLVGAAATAFAAFKGVSLFKRLLGVGSKKKAFKEGVAAGVAYKEGFAAGSAGTGAGGGVAGKAGKASSFRRLAGKVGKVAAPLALAGGVAIEGEKLSRGLANKITGGIPLPFQTKKGGKGGAVSGGALGHLFDQAVKAAEARPVILMANGQKIGEVAADNSSRAKARR